MTTSRYLAQALRGLAEDVRRGQASEYHAVCLERIAEDITRLNARDLIGHYECADERYARWGTR